MIGYLCGKVVDQADGRLLVAVGDLENFGAVGYSVTVPGRVEYQELTSDRRVEFFIHTHVREDSLDLFGFLSREEKDLFQVLLQVNGIGPKAAVNLLSSIEPGQLIDSILQQDKAMLTSLPGIGKKTAERVVLEILEPLKKKVESGFFDRFKRGRVATARVEKSGKFADFGILNDAKAALLGLGYREQDVARLMSEVTQEVQENSAIRPQRVEDVIRIALQRLS